MELVCFRSWVQILLPLIFVLCVYGGLGGLVCWGWRSTGFAGFVVAQVFVRFSFGILIVCTLRGFDVGSCFVVLVVWISGFVSGFGHMVVLPLDLDLCLRT